MLPLTELPNLSGSDYRLTRTKLLTLATRKLRAIVYTDRNKYRKPQDIIQACKRVCRPNQTSFVLQKFD